MSKQDLPLEGLKVVEVATWIAAPVAATILGDLGADVIKVEPPGEGDPYRGLPQTPAFEDVGVDYMWIMDARGKRSITLNLKNEGGREVLHRLIRDCDVYITNQPHPIRERFGLTYEELSEINPRMIYASLTAFGELGPERDKAGFDQVAYWARSGLLDLVRSPGAPPAQGLPGMGDHPSGVSLYAAILTALFRRERTGVGGMVHTSLHANGFWSNGCLGQAALAGVRFDERRQEPEPGERRPQSATHVLYPCACGQFLQLNMVRTDAEIAATYDCLGLGEVLDEPRFATLEDRFENGAELAAMIAEVVRTRSLPEWLERFAAASVPASHMARPEDMGKDEQAIANGILLDAKGSGVGMDYVINHPIGVGANGVRDERGSVKAPDAGEHSREVLKELGYSDSEIATLEADGALSPEGPQ